MSEFLDELARSMARPMPRSRAVRVVGAALASAAVPTWIRPHAAQAGRGQCPPKPTCPQKSAPELTKFCGVVNIGNDKCVKYRYRCCGKDDVCCEAGCCPPCTECVVAGDDIDCKPKVGVRACSAIDPGSKKSEVKCCPPDECCFDNGPFGKGQVKVACCPREKCCGGECCGPKQTCVNRKCKCDDPKKRKCGKDCCTKGQPCCEGKICCRKEGGTCCGIDCCDPKTEQNCCKRGTGTRCCPKDTKCCGKECCDKRDYCIPGPKPECCDFIQYAEEIRVCCPPGTVGILNHCCSPALGGECCKGVTCPPPKPGQPPMVCVNGRCESL